MTPSRPPKSPREVADDAKGAHDMEGEIAALTDGARALTEAPWYPLLPGDHVTIHFEHTPAFGAYTETYLVAELIGPNGPRTPAVSLLCLGCEPDTPDIRQMCGFYAGEDFNESVRDLWIEAGPGRLTITRNGKIIHNGPETWQ